MKINNDTIELIKQYEGLRLDAYPDPATKNDPIKKGKPWTIGFGTTIYPNGILVKSGDKITEKQSIEYLINDINHKAKLVEKLIKSKVNENQFGALVSFTYNEGQENLRTSNLLKLVNLNPNDPKIALEFSKWKYANGKVMSGLVKRRASENELYFKNIG